MERRALTAVVSHLMKFDRSISEPPCACYEIHIRTVIQNQPAYHLHQNEHPVDAAVRILDMLNSRSHHCDSIKDLFLLSEPVLM